MYTFWFWVSLKLLLYILLFRKDSIHQPMINTDANNNNNRNECRNNNKIECTLNWKYVCLFRYARNYHVQNDKYETEIQFVNIMNLVDVRTLFVYCCLQNAVVMNAKQKKCKRNFAKRHFQRISPFTIILGSLQLISSPCV